MIELPTRYLLNTLCDIEHVYDENIRKIKVRKHKSPHNDTIWVDTFSIYCLKSWGYIFEYSVQLNNCWERIMRQYELDIPRIKQIFGAHYYQYIVGFWMIKELDILEDIRYSIWISLINTIEDHNKKYEFHYL